MKGHNTGAEELRTIVARIEKLAQERDAIAGDIRDVFAESKSRGFDVRALREVIKLRKLGNSEREEREAVVDTYKQHLGMLPLFEREGV